MILMRYRRALLSGVFIVTEALAWFAVLAVIATMTEQAFLDGMVDRLQLAVNARQLPDLGRAESVLAQLREAQRHAAGPAWYVVVLAAGGGFSVMRLLRRLDIGGALGAVLLTATTLLGVNLLVHLSIGNWQVWDAAYITDIVSRPDSQVASRADLEAYVAQGAVRGPYGVVVALTFVGLFLTWFRFMLAARAPMRLEKMGRSFTASFMVILITLIVGRATGTQAAGWVAVPQFMLGMLGMAIANHERAVPTGDAQTRTSPWMTSVGGTLALLLASVGLIAMLAYLQIGSVLSVAGDWLLAVIQFLLVAIATPIAWVLERVFAWLLDGRTLPEGFMQMPNLAPPDVPADAEAEPEGIVPEWGRDTLKFFAIVGVMYGLYMVARILLNRRDSETEEVEEHRQVSSGGAGLGHLLGDLLSFRRRPDPDRWLERHAVYRLFADAVNASGERGLRILPTETPEEFGRAAVTYLDAEPVADVAVLFEDARYGRHYPAPERLREASSALDTWDRAHPPTEEMRERVRGTRPLDEGAEIAFRVALAKKGISLEDESTVRGD
ncbi:MAG: DUF4129 domain-containing protein [Chloroflexi bacterium]|nr:DUF4129 domain-containing protein [Chloroflexota bacterium]